MTMMMMILTMMMLMLTPLPPSPIGRRKSLDAVLTSRYDMISSPVGFRPPSPSLPARHIKDINSHAQTNKFMWPPLQSNWRNWNWININSDAQTNKFFWPYPKSNWRYCTKVNWLWRISEPNNGAGKWLYRFAWLRWDKYTFKNPWLSHLVCSVGMLLVIWRPMADMLDMRRELYGELIGMPATPPRAIVPKYVGTTITDCQRYCPWFEIYYDWFCGSGRIDDYNRNSGTLLYLANIIAVIAFVIALQCSRSHFICHCCRSSSVLVAIFVVVVIVIVAYRLCHIAMWALVKQENALLSCWHLLTLAEWDLEGAKRSLSIFFPPLFCRHTTRFSIIWF